MRGNLQIEVGSKGQSISDIKTDYARRFELRKGHFHTNLKKPTTLVRNRGPDVKKTYHVSDNHFGNVNNMVIRGMGR